MKPDHGVWYGIAFDTVLFGAIFLIFWVRHRAERAKWHRAHPPVPGSARRMLARLKRLARPSAWLVPAVLPGFSKLGGDPELPEGLARPWGASGRSMFLAQIDFAELQAGVPIDWLPADGRIFAFYDLDLLGFADAVQVLHVETGRPGVGAAGVGGPQRPERRIGFESLASIPSSEWLHSTEVLDMAYDLFAAQVETLVGGPSEAAVRHRIGGYPDEIQNECLRLECEYLARGLPGFDDAAPIPPAIDRASKTWRLLFQIDSDPELKMAFGDGGMLYVFIREKDARAGDFSRTITLMQCY